MMPAEIASLTIDLERARQSALQGGQGSKGGFDFHERILLASRNRRIYDTLYGDLQPLMRIYRRQSGAVPAREEAAYQEHWQVLRAIKSGDGELAESLTRSHIARASQHVIQRLAEAGEGVPARRA